MRRFAPEGRDTPMKMTRQLYVFFAAILFVLPAYAQDSAKNAAAPNLAASPSAALLKQWNEIGRKLIVMAEDFPEDKYDFKAAPSTGTFAERMIHGAATNYFFTNLALGQELPSEEDPPRAQFENKAAIVAYVKKSFADGAAAIKSKGDKRISTLVIDPFAEDVPGNAGKEQDSARRFGLWPDRALRRSLRPALRLLPRS